MHLTYYLFLNIPKFIFSLKWNNNYYFIRTHNAYIMMLSYFIYKDLNLQARMLVDFTCVDYLSYSKRFNLVYHFLSIDFHFRIFFKFFISELESVYSLIYLYPNISWYERECWDLFGVYFLNNSFLRRILTDYSFQGNPLKKDFPLTGFVEYTYSYFFSSVVQRKIHLRQSYRFFETQSVWLNHLIR